jgi:hypothetical protein
VVKLVYFLEVALEDVVGGLVLLEGLGVSGGDDLPSEVQVLQPVVVVQPLSVSLQVPLQVPLGEGLRKQAPKLLFSDKAVRA